MKDFIHNGNLYVFEGDECIVNGGFRLTIPPSVPKTSGAEQRAPEERDSERDGEQDSGGQRDASRQQLLPSIEELKKDHHLLRCEFEASDEWALLVAHFEREQRKGLTLSKIVALGMGTSQVPDYEDFTQKQMQQEAAALSSLKTLLNIEICVAQEPIFTSVDKNFLGCLGITTVEDPSAFGIIDKQTLVWIHWGHIAVHKRIADGVHPAALICRNIDNGHEGEAGDGKEQEDPEEDDLEQCQRGDESDNEPEEDIKRRIIKEFQEMRRWLWINNKASSKMLTEGYSKYPLSSTDMSQGKVLSINHSLYIKKGEDLNDDLVRE